MSTKKYFEFKFHMQTQNEFRQSKTILLFYVFDFEYCPTLDAHRDPGADAVPASPPSIRCAWGALGYKLENILGWNVDRFVWKHVINCMTMNFASTQFAVTTEIRQGILNTWFFICYVHVKTDLRTEQSILDFNVCMC